jgi:beta-lactam-binding protein with PASTA domain
VPKVLGLRLNAAERRIGANYCSVGTVRHVRSRRSLRGRVVNQKPRPGTIKRRDFPVKLAVGRS